MYQSIFYDNRKNKIHLWDDHRGYVTFPYKKYAYIKSAGGTYVSLYGDRLQKVYKIEKDGAYFESDVMPEIRTLVDSYTESEEVSEGHKVLILDIEVEVTDGFPDVRRAENIITSIAIYDDITEEYHCFILDKKGEVESTDTIHPRQTEYDLLKSFMTKYLEISPTILTGWNVEFFDMPYLFNRMIQVIGYEMASCLSPIQIVKHIDRKDKEKEQLSIKIAGVNTLDYFQLYRKFTFSERPSYRLDAIGDYELGQKKVEYEGTLNDLYEGDINKFVEYNIHDCRLVKLLNDKLNFIEIARGLAHVGHVPYEDIFMSSRYLEGAILTYLKNKKIVAPNKPKRRIKKKDMKKFVGAYVQEPQKGKHSWVYDLDITSMYPSCIMSLNISPETKVGKIKGWNPEEFLDKNNRKTYTITKNGKDIGKLTEKEVSEYLSESKVSIATNGVMYKTEKKGLLAALLEKWFNERVEYRKLAKKFHEQGDTDKSEYFDRRQYLQKILLNSLYGVLGLPVFRFYDLDNAEAVTYTGQSLIKFTKKIANSYYNKELDDTKDHCIYIDTDSVFYSATPVVKKRFPNQKLNDVMMTQRILEIASEVQNYLNNSYDYFAKKFCNIDTHRFEIKQEVIAKAGLFVTKKRYGMKIINDNGRVVNKMLVKGLDTVRSSFPTAMKELLAKLLEDILMEVPKDKLDEYVLNFKKSMKLMNFDKIAMPIGVRGIRKYAEIGENGVIIPKLGTPVHVKASYAYNNFLTIQKLNRYEKIGESQKIKWVYLKNNPYGFKVIAYKGYEDPKKLMDFIKTYIDTDKIYKQALDKKIFMFYNALNWVMPVDKKNTLERFF
jgi:DNA polymerase elongation subunit (family B)